MDRIVNSLRLDNFTLAIIGTFVLASIVPAHGSAAGILDGAVKLSQ